jgi:hypothetical protein
MATLLRRILRGVGLVFGLLYFASEDIARFLVAPILAGLARLRVWLHVERLIASLPPYGALCVLAVPMIVLEPVKLLALWRIASGSLLAGAALLVAAKIAGMAVILRLHAIAEPKLMSIAWYKRVHDWVLALRRRIYLSVMSYATVRNALKRARTLLRELRARAANLRRSLAPYFR